MDKIVYFPKAFVRKWTHQRVLEFKLDVWLEMEGIFFSFEKLQLHPRRYNIFCLVEYEITNMICIVYYKDKLFKSEINVSLVQVVEMQYKQLKKWRENLFIHDTVMQKWSELGISRTIKRMFWQRFLVLLHLIRMRAHVTDQRGKIIHKFDIFLRFSINYSIFSSKYKWGTE